MLSTTILNVEIERPYQGYKKKLDWIIVTYKIHMNKKSFMDSIARTSILGDLKKIEGASWDKQTVQQHV